jgi:hypothetical protein
MSSEDFTKAVVLKRSAKKKSGYTIVEKDGEYFVEETPAKARVNEGDKVVGINGINSDEFVDADDANDLVESIRIVVVPEDKIQEYEAAKEAEDGAGEESSEDELEEVERPRGAKAKGGAESALVVRDNDVSEKSHLRLFEVSDSIILIRIMHALSGWRRGWRQGWRKNLCMPRLWTR